jgi:hypothetical protein
MKTYARVLLITFILLVFLAYPSTAFAKGLLDDQIIAGSNYSLASGETQDGSLIVFGGNVSIDNGAVVNGDIVIFGGNLDLSGEVNGSVIGLGSNSNLSATASISGDLVSLGGGFQRDPEAQILGQVITEGQLPLRVAIPSITIPEIQPGLPRLDYRANTPINIVLSIFWFLFRVFITAALAILVVLLFPKPTERTSQAIARQPMLSFLVGLLTLIVMPIILVVMSLTILLIPIAFIAAVLLAAILFYGWVSMGYFLGLRMMGMFKVGWAPAVAAGVGTFTLSFVAWLFSSAVPCVGWLLPWLLAMFGVGAVLITRVGTQTYLGTDLGASGGAQLPGEISQ